MNGMVARWYIREVLGYRGTLLQVSWESMWFIYPLMVPNESIYYVIEHASGKNNAAIITTLRPSVSCPLNAFRSLYISNLIPGSTAASYMKCQYHAP